MKKPPPARLHLLPAKAAPYTVIFRRKPTDWFHVLRWNTQIDTLEHGSWYAGTLYPKRADVSFDGEWMVFLAMDPGSNTFNRIARPPLLTPVAEVPADGTYRGGGYWESASVLRPNGWFAYAKGRRKKVEDGLPPNWALDVYGDEYGDELGDAGVLYRRLARDGWHEGAADEWWNRPTAAHPTLRMLHTGYKNGTMQFKFWLTEFPTLIPDMAEWACWDCLGQLLFANKGVVYKFGLDALASGQPTTVIDLEHLAPPPV